MRTFLPTLSKGEIAGRLTKHANMRRMQAEKRKLIAEYQESRRKLNVIGYREVQKENLALENLKKGGLTRGGAQGKEAPAQTEGGQGAQEKADQRVETPPRRKGELGQKVQSGARAGQEWA